MICYFYNLLLILQGTMRAAVLLPNGPRFMGPDGVNQHAAVDMVSNIAMRQLVSQTWGKQNDYM